MLRAALLALLLVSCGRPSLTPFFSPSGGATYAVVQAIGQAQREVLVQAYGFTSTAIAEALLAAHQRGVTVRVILDKSNRTDAHSQGPTLAKAGVPVWIDAAHSSRGLCRLNPIGFLDLTSWTKRPN